MGVHQFLGEGSHKKTIYRGDCIKRGLGQFAGDLVIIREVGAFEEREGGYTLMHTMIGFVDVSGLNWSGSFLQYNAKKKINSKSSSRFKFKC